MVVHYDCIVLVHVSSTCCVLFDKSEFGQLPDPDTECADVTWLVGHVRRLLTWVLMTLRVTPNYSLHIYVLRR